MKRLRVLVAAELIIILVTLLMPNSKGKAVEVSEESIIQTVDSKSVYVAHNEAEVITEDIQKNDDIELLARLIYGEAGADYCSDEMRYLVGAVALNRVKSKYFPDTLAEVIDQAGQYDCLNYRYFYQEPSESCYRIAYELITYGYDVPNTVVFQSEFIQGKGVYKQVQNMYFCYR